MDQRLGITNAAASMREDSPHAGGGKAWWAVGLLAVFLIISLLDRTVLALLIGPLKRDLSLSDVQVGLLLGTAFGIVYSVLGVPAARLADQGNRHLLVVAGVMIWCLSTLASGFATGFAVLLLLRMGLAVGEAVLTPTAYSLIGDFFPPEKRSLAASIYSAAGLAGPPLAFLAGSAAIQGIEYATAHGLHTSFHVWQLVLFIVAAPGILLGFVFGATVREPPRTGERDLQRASAGVVVRQLLAHKRLYAGLMLGAALVQVAGYAFQYWGVELLKRDFHWTAPRAGSVFGAITLVAGVGGTLLGPFLSRLLGRRGRHDGVVLVTAGFFLVGMAALVACPWQSNVAVFLVFLCLGMMGILGGTNNVMVSMQHVAPERMRATFVALLLMSVSLIGSGLGPVGAPAIAKLLSVRGDPLGPALSIVALASIAPAVTLMLWARAAFERESRLGFPTVGALASPTSARQIAD